MTTLYFKTEAELKETAKLIADLTEALKISLDALETALPYVSIEGSDEEEALVLKAISLIKGT